MLEPGNIQELLKEAVRLSAIDQEYADKVKKAADCMGEIQVETDKEIFEKKLASVLTEIQQKVNIENAKKIASMGDRAKKDFADELKAEMLNMDTLIKRGSLSSESSYSTTDESSDSESSGSGVKLTSFETPGNITEKENLEDRNAVSSNSVKLGGSTYSKVLQVAPAPVPLPPESKLKFGRTPISKTDANRLTKKADFTAQDSNMVFEFFKAVGEALSDFWQSISSAASALGNACLKTCEVVAKAQSSRFGNLYP